MSCRETNSHAFTPKTHSFQYCMIFCQISIFPIPDICFFSPFIWSVYVCVSVYVLVLVSCILCMQHSCKTYLQMLHSI